jgi:hypothetical protein
VKQEVENLKRVKIAGSAADISSPERRRRTMPAALVKTP